jgi:hypothetical protein
MGASVWHRGHLLFEFYKESPAGVERFKLHTQCPVRLRRDSTVLVGSYDTHRPVDEDVDWTTAFDTSTTVYDERAREVEASLDKHDCRVTSARLRHPAWSSSSWTTGRRST